VSSRIVVDAIVKPAIMVYDDFPQREEKVAADIRIGVLVDRDRGRGVRGEDRTDPVAHTRLRDNPRDLCGHVDDFVVIARAQLEATAEDGHDGGSAALVSVNGRFALAPRFPEHEHETPVAGAKERRLAPMRAPFVIRPPGQ